MKICALALIVGLAGLAHAESEIDHAIALYRAKKYPDARAVLEKIAAAEPANAAACYYLGMTLLHRSEPGALDDAAQWLKKAVQLEPDNPHYLADYGGTELQRANKNRSLSAATDGREAMEKAIRLDPGNLDAREGLMRFYDEAPWPLGSSAKAREQREQIRQRDPERGLVLEVQLKARAKDYAGAFALCDQVLSHTPDNYAALFHYGRTATLCGQNLERGLVCLQRCLKLTPPPAQPGHAEVWIRLGNIYEQLGRKEAARAAYASALKLNPDNGPAAEALGKLR